MTEASDGSGVQTCGGKQAVNIWHKTSTGRPANSYKSLLYPIQRNCSLSIEAVEVILDAKTFLYSFNGLHGLYPKQTDLL